MNNFNYRIHLQNCLSISCTVTFAKYCHKIKRYHVIMSFYLKSKLNFLGKLSQLKFEVVFITHWAYKRNFSHLVGEHEIKYIYKTLRFQEMWQK